MKHIEIPPSHDSFSLIDTIQKGLSFPSDPFLPDSFSKDDYSKLLKKGPILLAPLMSLRTIFKQFISFKLILSNGEDLESVYAMTDMCRLFYMALFDISSLSKLSHLDPISVSRDLCSLSSSSLSIKFKEHLTLRVKTNDICFKVILFSILNEFDVQVSSLYFYVNSSHFAICLYHPTHKYRESFSRFRCVLSFISRISGTSITLKKDLPSRYIVIFRSRI